MNSTSTTINTCISCKGSGRVPTPDGHDSTDCECTRLERTRSWVNERFPGVEPLSPGASSPLIHVKDGLYAGDRFREDLIIRGTWKLFTQHLRATLGCRHRAGLIGGAEDKSKYRILSDEDLRIAYFVPSQNGEKGIHYGGLSSIISDRPQYDGTRRVGDEHLYVVRLAQSRVRNVVLPDILHQFLLLARDQRRHVWLIAESHEPFLKGHRTHNEDVAAFVRSYFTGIDLASGAITPPSEGAN